MENRENKKNFQESTTEILEKISIDFSYKQDLSFWKKLYWK